MGKAKKAIAVVVLLAVAAALLAPLIPVDVAYSEVEPYSRECQYVILSASLRRGWSFTRGVYHVSEVTVKNVDSRGGDFTVTHYLYDVNGLYGVKRTTEYLAPGETKTFKAEFDTRLFQDVRGEYSVSAPTVVDWRVVVKHKTVYKSIIEVLTYR